MKRRWWIALGIGVAGVIGLIVALSVFFGDPINRENAEKIQTGMTEADVVRLLGRSPNGSTFVEFQECLMEAGRPVVMGRTVTLKTWNGSRMRISVAFKQDGTVDGDMTRFEEGESMFAGIRRWLGLDPQVVPPPPMPAYQVPTVAPAPTVTYRAVSQ